MRMAMQDVGLNEDVVAALMNAFFATADWMRNRE